MRARDWIAEKLINLTSPVIMMPIETIIIPIESSLYKTMKRQKSNTIIEDVITFYLKGEGYNVMPGSYIANLIVTDNIISPFFALQNIKYRLEKYAEIGKEELTETDIEEIKRLNKHESVIQLIIKKLGLNSETDIEKELLELNGAEFIKGVPDKFVWSNTDYFFAEIKDRNSILINSQKNWFNKFGKMFNIKIIRAIQSPTTNQ